MKKIFAIITLTIAIIGCKKELRDTDQKNQSLQESQIKKPSPPPANANPAIAYRSIYRVNPNRLVWGLYVMDANGANKTKVYTNYSANTAQSPDFPAWSQDGSKLCFTLNGNDLYTLAITIVNGIPTGSNATKIGDGVLESGSYRKGVWNPGQGANEIAVVWKQDPNPTSIRIVPANGGTPTSLYTSPNTGFTIEDHISFSPDGSKLAIVERQNPTAQNTLKIIDRVSGNVITSIDLSQFFKVTGLDWSNSSGSNIIAFTIWPLCSVDNNGHRKLYSIDISASTPVPTLLSGIERDYVTWSSDDLKIVSMGGSGLSSTCNPSTGCCFRNYYGLQSFTLSTQSSAVINSDTYASNPDWEK